MAIAITETGPQSLWYEESTDDGRSYVVQDTLVEKQDAHTIFMDDLHANGGGVPAFYTHEIRRSGPMTPGEAATILALMNE